MKRTTEPTAHGIAESTTLRRHFPWFALLVLVWSLEILAVQETTSLPSDVLSTMTVVKYAARRMVLNVAACMFLVCVLNRFWLYLAFGLQLFAFNVLIVYASYFATPLSWFTLRHQWQEGLAVADFGVALIQWPIFLSLFSVLVVKIALRELLRRRGTGEIHRRRIARRAAVVYVVLAALLAGVYKPISKLRLGTPEYAYGYSVAWVAEGLFFDEKAILQLALDAAAQKSDCLTPRETPLEIGDRLAIVQVESLDVDVIDARVRGEWVMPFLHELKTRSMYYIVRPAHETGSAEADFTVLTGTMPNGVITPYKVQGYPYCNTLVQRARRRGYSCVFLHGYTGSFFSRREAYEQMGFSKICFSEELRELGCTLTRGAVEDAEVLQISAQWMRESRQRAVHFIITMTSHGPFNRLPPDKMELFADPSSKMEAYLNSMRYVDRALESYWNALPEGTTLVLYGDHESGVYGQSENPEDERVPCFIHRKGRNLAKSQATRGTELAQSGKLHMLDLATYLHNSFDQSSVAGHDPASQEPSGNRFQANGSRAGKPPGQRAPVSVTTRSLPGNVLQKGIRK